MNPTILTRNFVLRLRDTDAAGVIFFSRGLELAHDLYEDWMAQIGLPIGQLLREGKIGFPCVHANIDHKFPARCGDILVGSLMSVGCRNTSFELQFEFRDQAGRLIWRAATVHVCLDVETKKPAPLPQNFDPFRVATE